MSRGADRGRSLCTVELSRKAHKQFKRLSAGDQRSVREALLKLAERPLKSGSFSGQSVKKIKGRADNFYRLRVGNHRVMFDLDSDDKVVLVLGIVDRKNLEKWLRQQ